jgi:hypothetical protein
MSISIVLMSALIVPLCSNSTFKTALVGTWAWTGDKCDGEGNCIKEIITDEQSGESFSSEGLYVSKNSRINYTLKGNKIYFASDNYSYDQFYAEIVSIKNGMMLLKFNDGIKRYIKITKK